MKCDVIIIGAGIIGLATAERLLMHGAKVTLLERNLVGHESSWAGGGILAPLYPWNYANEVIQLAHHSAQQFSSWVMNLQDKTGIDPEYQLSGMMLYPPFDKAGAAKWCVEQKTIFALGEKPSKWSGSVIKECDQALYFPSIAQVRNPRLIRALHMRITQLGGRIIENCAINRINARKRHVQSITSEYDEFVADYYIVSAGAWSQTLLSSIPSHLGIKPIKGQMLLFKYESPPVPTILVQDGIYLIPRKDGHVLVGSTLEDTGFDKQTTLTVQNYLLSCASGILPSLNKKSIVKHWAGLRPASPGNIPTIGRHPEILNLFINSGHFRYGVTMAPASAEILSNEIIKAKQPFDIFPYRWL